MKKTDLGLELWTVRDLCAQDFPGTMKLVSDIGYKCVQPAGYYGYRPTEFKKILDDNGLAMPSSHHIGGNDINEQMDLADMLGIKTLCAWIGAPADFETLDKIKEGADRVNAMIERVEKYGFEVHQHNHYWEFERIDGKLKYDYLHELCPKLKCELDVYWSTNYFTEDPVEILKKYAPKTTLLHLKDGTGSIAADGTKEMTLMPLGTGALPIPEIMKYVPEHCREIYVELDSCNIPVPEAIRISYDYMVQNGFAAGNR